MVRYKFDEIAINSTEKKKPVEEDKYTYLGLDHLDSGTLKVSRFGADVAPIGEKLIMRKGDVLFGKRRAYQKKVAIAPFDGIFSAHGMVLRPRTDVIKPKLFPFFVSSNHFLDEAIKISVGSLSPTINWRDLKDLEFNIPPIEKQDVLADQLWAMEETKEAYNQLLIATDALVKSQFIEMFGDYLSNIECYRRLDDLYSYISRGKSPKYVDFSSVNVVNQACIYWDYLKFDNVKYHEERPIPDERYLRTNDILINSTGTGTLGRCNIFKPNDLNVQYIADGHVTVLRGCTEILPIFYKHYFMRDDTQKEIYSNHVSGSTNQIELSKERLKGFSIPCPPLSLQKQFANFVEHTDKSKFDKMQCIISK